MNRIILYDIVDAIMLVVEHPSGVVYSNQAGGVVCLQPELEGVLAPLDFPAESVAKIEELGTRIGGGLTPELADELEAILVQHPGMNYIRIDRSRLSESREAWVFVEVDTPTDTEVKVTGPYFGALFGFGRVHGVLTWPNSD